MEYKDFLITPVYLGLFYILAYMIRPFVTNGLTRRFFIPALTVKFAGAIIVGLIYQFYYGGGDTFSFTTHGSSHIWEAFLDSPGKAFRMLTLNAGERDPETFEYTSRIPFYKDRSSYFIIRVAGLFSFFSFHTYSTIALFFALLSFTGSWAFYNVFCNLYNHLSKPLAYGILFVPSVFFWGSGILKDTLTLAALGWFTYAIYRLFIINKRSLSSLVLIAISSYVLINVKIYIFLCFAPAAILWVFIYKSSQIRSQFIKIITLPFFLVIGAGIGYYAIDSASGLDNRYQLDHLAERAMITAHDIRYMTGRNAGSGYSLGELDGSFTNMLLLAPAAINVSLFRPYLWEVRNPLMLISALESFAILILTLWIIFRKGRTLIPQLKNPNILFCLIFSLTFAFAVGVATYNFGSLSRYKIPLFPFYLTALVLLNDEQKGSRSMTNVTVK